MGVHSSDGMAHHSMSRAKMHEERMGSAKPPTKTKVSEPKSKSLKDPGKGQAEGASIEEHVKAHGPAHAVHHIEHEGTHHVFSHHEGGAEATHHSTHGSAEEAHEHMGKAMGIGAEAQEPTESPDDAEAMPMGGGGGIPGLNG